MSPRKYVLDKPAAHVRVLKMHLNNDPLVVVDEVMSDKVILFAVNADEQVALSVDGILWDLFDHRSCKDGQVAIQIQAPSSRPLGKTLQ